jgi:hypothetical protein
MAGNFLSPATNQDLKPGSAAMTALNNYNSTAQRIAIIAQENSPVHWRMISSQKNGNDYELVGTMGATRGFYHSTYYFHDDLRIACSLTLNFPGAAYHAAAAGKWKKGRDWFDNSETIWNTLIKTSRVETATYTVTITRIVPCNPREPLGLAPPDAENPGYDLISDVCHEIITETHTRQVTVNYPSDGLIPTYAQELKGVAPANRYTIDYANHLELKDMSISTTPNGQPNDGTKNTLNTIFDSSQSSNSWFYTPRR